jgi:hypothetical protein
MGLSVLAPASVVTRCDACITKTVWDCGISIENLPFIVTVAATKRNLHHGWCKKKNVDDALGNGLVFRATL